MGVGDMWDHVVLAITLFEQWSTMGHSFPLVPIFKRFKLKNSNISDVVITWIVGESLHSYSLIIK